MTSTSASGATARCLKSSVSFRCYLKRQQHTRSEAILIRFFKISKSRRMPSLKMLLIPSTWRYFSASRMVRRTAPSSPLTSGETSHRLTASSTNLLVRRGFAAPRFTLKMSRHTGQTPWARPSLSPKVQICCHSSCRLIASRSPKGRRNDLEGDKAGLVSPQQKLLALRAKIKASEATYILIGLCPTP